MLLAVAPTVEETEKLRRRFAKMHCFVFCATYQNIIRSAEEYHPDGVIISVPTVDRLIIQKVEKLREIFDDLAIITMSDQDVSALKPDVKLKGNPDSRSLQFESMFFADFTPKNSYSKGSMIIGGLLLALVDRCTFLYGQPIPFTTNEVFLLRYLAEIHPRRADWKELARFCFNYGKKTPRTTVVSTISRINQKAKELISSPIVVHTKDMGYGFNHK